MKKYIGFYILKNTELSRLFETTVEAKNISEACKLIEQDLSDEYELIRIGKVYYEL